MWKKKDRGKIKKRQFKIIERNINSTGVCVKMKKLKEIESKEQGRIKRESRKLSIVQ